MRAVSGLEQLAGIAMNALAQKEKTIATDATMALRTVLVDYLPEKQGLRPAWFGLGRTLRAHGAWVVVAPPNYAPGIAGSVTMYDVIHEVAAGFDPTLRPSFARQIFPLLERLVRQQWVNFGIFTGFGWGSAEDFTRPELLRQLARMNQPLPADEFHARVMARLHGPRSSHQLVHAVQTRHHTVSEQESPLRFASASGA